MNSGSHTELSFQRASSGGRRVAPQKEETCEKRLGSQKQAEEPEAEQPDELSESTPARRGGRRVNSEDAFGCKEEKNVTVQYVKGQTQQGIYYFTEQEVWRQGSYRDGYRDGFASSKTVFRDCLTLFQYYHPQDIGPQTLEFQILHSLRGFFLS